MAYNNIITRSEAASLIPEDVASEIIQSVPQSSVIMQLARKLPNLPRRVQRMPMLSVLPQAYFVAETGGYSGSGPEVKQTSEVNWADTFLYAEELAVIIPIPENVLSDSDYDIWGEVRPRLVEAFGKKFDETVLFAGLGSYTKPTDWPNGIVKQAFDAGNYVTAGTGADLYDDLLGSDTVTGVWGAVEEDGYNVTGAIGAMSMMRRIRSVRGSDGSPIFTMDPTSAFSYRVNGVQSAFPANGAFDPAQALLVAGDWNQLYFAMRQDITFKILDQAVLTNSAGAIQYNLPQQDMVALRAVMRLGWVCPNPVNQLNTNNSTRFPFAYLKP